MAYHWELGLCLGRRYGSCSVSLTGNNAEGTKNSVSTPMTNLVQLHFVGTEVILVGLCDYPVGCTVTTQLML